MANPSDLYIRFLITKGFDEHKKVEEYLKEINLGHSVSSTDFEKQYDLVEKSLPSSVMRQTISKNYEADFLKWMGILEIKEAWQNEQKYLDLEIRRKWILLYGIMDDPHLKLSLNSLLVKNVSSVDTADLVNIRFSALLRVDHVDLYKKYIFDPRRMTRKDWKAFLALSTPKEKHVYFTALTEPLDILKTELELPADINVSTPLQYLLTKSFQKAKMYLELSTPEANREARAWISQVSDLTGKYEKYRTGDKTDFAKQLQMQFDFIDNEFPNADSETLLQLQEELGLKKEQ